MSNMDSSMKPSAVASSSINKEATARHECHPQGWHSGFNKRLYLQNRVLVKLDRDGIVLLSKKDIATDMFFCC